MSKKKKIIVFVVIGVLLIAYIGFAVSNVSRNQNESGIPKNALPVEIESAHLQTIVSKVGVKGTVELVEVETVFGQATATVQEVYVKEGEEVKAGQTLVDYDAKAVDKLHDQLAEARLAVKSARLSLNAALTTTQESDRLRFESAKTDYDNAQKLYDAGAIAKKELDPSYEALTRAEDAQKSTQNQIALLQVTVEQSELRISLIQKELANFVPSETAPQDGTVIAAYVKKGDMATEGRPLFDIADISPQNLVIKANVPEGDARNLALGQEVEIRADALGQTVYKGEIAKISPLASLKQIGNSMETAITLDISFKEAPLKSGYTVDATIITKTVADAVVVPLMSTLRELDGSNYVYIMHDDYSVEKRLVELGEYAGIYVEAGNVSVGEKLIVNPSAQIQEGVFVKPMIIRNPGN
jgi:RND family efflux transporter MFP subunit